MPNDVSHAPEIVVGAVAAEKFNGWHDPDVAIWQHKAYRALLDEMYAADVRLDLQVASNAVTATGCSDPIILEVGCGSGYYSEVLDFLQKRTLAYTGLDYSKAMIDLAAAQYPAANFVVGDATAMEFASESFDIVINGAALMHIPEYKKAISESARVSRRWCIFHTIPVVYGRPTTIIKKEAYGGSVVEITFNRGELEDIFQEMGLRIIQVYDNISHDYLNEIMGERVGSVTFLCERGAA